MTDELAAKFREQLQSFITSPTLTVLHQATKQIMSRLFAQLENQTLDYIKLSGTSSEANPFLQKACLASCSRLSGESQSLASHRWLNTKNGKESEQINVIRHFGNWNSIVATRIMHFWCSRLCLSFLGRRSGLKSFTKNLTRKPWLLVQICGSRLNELSFHGAGRRFRSWYWGILDIFWTRSTEITSSTNWTWWSVARFSRTEEFRSNSLVEEGGNSLLIS